jgi:DNA-binding response OmpR family regulator
VPVVLSARHAEPAKVHALDAGADDYVTKPFGMDELLARMRAALRRATPATATALVTTDAFTVDLAAKQVTTPAGEVRLTPTEWHLLEVIVREPGRLVTHQQLLQQVWTRLRHRNQLPACPPRQPAPQTRTRPGPTPLPHHRTLASGDVRDHRPGRAR